MKKIFTLIAFACFTALSAMAAKVTTITDIAKAIAEGTVVNLCIGDTYLYGPNDQNTAMGSANEAKASANGCVGYKIEKDGDNYMFRCVTPSGGDYMIWGRTEPNYLNAQPSVGGVTFNLNNGTQKGTDMANGAVWSIEADGSIKNVGNGGYFAGTKTSADPVAVTFVTIEADPEPEREKITVLESLKPFIENKTIFTLKTGDSYMYGPDNQNIAMGTWEQASACEHIAGYILESTEYEYLLRAVKADGSDVTVYGKNPCYLNTQPRTGGAIFNLGVDQDCKNGSSWILEEASNGTYTIKSVATGGYLQTNTTNETATEWELYVPKPVSTHTWDFTNWSDETKANLKADAATNEKTEGDVTYGEGTNWTYVEKTDTDKKGNALAIADRNPQQDKCYWQLVIEKNPTANGVAIKELKGLDFTCQKSGKDNPRSLAIAVDYASTSLGTYQGAQYLWLGGSGVEYFTIKNVKVGSTIKMGVESHKPTDARGVTLTNVAENPATPTVFEEQQWTVSGTGDVADVVVTNTNGCHIYYIDAEIVDVADAIKNTTVNEVVTAKFVKNGNIVIIKNGKMFNVNGTQVK